MTTYNIPAKTKEAIDRYVEHGIQLGGFLTACLCNNLTRAVFHADKDNREALTEIVKYIHWEIPGDCWGNIEIVEAWIEKKQEERFIGNGD